jgi:hypothetical protein
VGVGGGAWCAGGGSELQAASASRQLRPGHAAHHALAANMCARNLHLHPRGCYTAFFSSSFFDRALGTPHSASGPGLQY